MNHIIAIYIFVTFIFNFIWWGIIPASEEISACPCNPKWVYNHTKTNWFGTICLTILTNAVFGPAALCYWFYKLCTVGRR